MAGPDEELIRALENDEDLPNRVQSSSRGSGLEVSFLLLILGFALGAVLSTFGLELFADNAAVIFSAMLGLVICLAAIFVLLIIVRKPLWSRLFHRTEIEIERLAGPLSNVARHAAEKDVPKATGAARDLAELFLARYAWLATRRWLLASITGIIAAIAALAGSALLFQQNELLKAQGESLVTQTNLLREQNQRIDSQIALLQLDARLKDSDRSAGILPNIVAVSALLGDEIERLQDELKIDENGNYALKDITPSLRNQLITITNTVRPYRYLKSRPANANMTQEMMEIGFQRRTDLPKQAQMLGVRDSAPEFGLIDHPVSPERGAIIHLLHNFDLKETELLSFFGADFSYAEVSIPNLVMMTFRLANLRFSEFRHIDMQDVDFGAAGLDNARFLDSFLIDVNFQGFPASEAPGRYRKVGETFFMATQTHGVSFERSMLLRADFSNIQGFAQNFDNTLVANSKFVDASLAGATFRDAILIDNDFTGAFLNSVDFDGAVVFSATFLDQLKDTAAAGTFKAERFELEPIGPADLNNYPLYNQVGIRVDQALVEGLQAFRVRRVQPFEQ